MDEKQLGDASFQLAAAIEQMGERRAWQPRDMVTVAALAAFTLAGRNLAGTGAVEFIRDIADTVERQYLPRP